MSFTKNCRILNLVFLLELNNDSFVFFFKLEIDDIVKSLTLPVR